MTKRQTRKTRLRQAEAEVTTLDKLPRVSVVIPARNEERYIERCLRSLIAQDYPLSRLEVIVADGDSTDATPLLVSRLAASSPLPIRLLPNPGRTTACGLNVGVRNASGDVIIILGAHSEAAPTFVSSSVAALDRSGADAVGGPIDTVAEGRVGQAVALALSSPFGVGDARFRYSQDEGPVDTVAFAAYRRQVFDKIGLFDESLSSNVDDEFNYRLAHAGGRLWLSPDIHSRYFSRSSLKALLRQYWRYGHWKMPVAQRHPRQIRPRHLVPSLLVAVLAVSGLLAPLSRLARIVFAATAISYAIASIIAATAIAARQGWPYLPWLPPAFACIHIGYGLGFWAGLLRFAVLPALQRGNGTADND